MIFLVDEAHNLVERAREMYSAALIKEDILAVNRILKSMERHEKRPEAAYNLRKYEKALSALNRSMLSYKRECDEFEVLEHLDAMEFQLLRFSLPTTGGQGLSGAAGKRNHAEFLF